MYRGKEKIHCQIELIIYWLKWYTSTCIISLVLLVLRPKLVLLLTDVFQNYLSASLSASASLCLRDTTSFILPQYWKSHGMSHYTTIIYSFLASFSHRFLLVFSLRCLSSSQIIRILISIPAYLNNAMVCMFCDLMEHQNPQMVQSFYLGLTSNNGLHAENQPTSQPAKNTFSTISFLFQKIWFVLSLFGLFYLITSTPYQSFNVESYKC